mmetsp:Transcript_28998/g.44588  ORF Transcript_28998/g.44588 Transcript_28998/m.44588 type:complete len:204 (+) Transcript_28998:84-695(+)
MTTAITAGESWTDREGPAPLILKVAVFAFVVLWRVLVGFQPHSGQDNYHGKENVYGGDYEAQRHWMELTLHLPMGDWYWYDLEYWGLDYPPLTAYISYLCGVVSHYLVGPHSVSLLDSRGIEDPIHKAYMRGTVLILDIMIYCSAVWYITKHTMKGDKASSHNGKSLWFVLVALSQVNYTIVLLFACSCRSYWKFMNQDSIVV